MMNCFKFGFVCIILQNGDPERAMQEEIYESWIVLNGRPMSLPLSQRTLFERFMSMGDG